MLAGAILPSLVVAAEPQAAVRALPAANTDAVKVPIYQSRVLTTRAPVKRISVGNPGIADILITTPTQLYLLGRSQGTAARGAAEGNHRSGQRPGRAGSAWPGQQCGSDGHRAEAGDQLRGGQCAAGRGGQ